MPHLHEAIDFTIEAFCVPREEVGLEIDLIGESWCLSTRGTSTIAS